MNRIEEHRKRRGWSRAKLARRVGVTERQVYRWERENQRPTAEKIPLIADELAVTAEDLDLGAGVEG